MFFKNLFDFKFEKFITRSVASVVYVISIIVLGIALLVIEIAALTMMGNDNGWGESELGLGILLFLAAPVGALLTLIFTRVAFESSIALITIAENTKK